MAEKVGRFTLLGKPWQNDAIRAMALKASDKYGDRLAQNVEVHFLPADEMPPRADGGASVGFTPTFRRIDLWERIGRYPVEETFAHEIGHAVPMSKKQKRAVEALATPGGGQWNAPGYADDVRESGALAQSRAVLGVVNPPYKRYYNHAIDSSKDAELAAVYLSPPIEPAEPDPTPPQPTPADPVALQKRIDELEAANEALEDQVAFKDQQIAALTSDLALAESRIVAKDTHFHEGLAV